jgi:hypothetical protein
MYAICNTYEVKLQKCTKYEHELRGIVGTAFAKISKWPIQKTMTYDVIHRTKCEKRIPPTDFYRYVEIYNETDVVMERSMTIIFRMTMVEALYTEILDNIQCTYKGDMDAAKAKYPLECIYVDTTAPGASSIVDNTDAYMTKQLHPIQITRVICAKLSEEDSLFAGIGVTAPALVIFYDVLAEDGNTYTLSQLRMGKVINVPLFATALYQLMQLNMSDVELSNWAYIGFLSVVRLLTTPRNIVYILRLFYLDDLAWYVLANYGMCDYNYTLSLFQPGVTVPEITPLHIVDALYLHTPYDIFAVYQMDDFLNDLIPERTAIQEYREQVLKLALGNMDTGVRDRVIDTRSTDIACEECEKLRREKLLPTSVEEDTVFVTETISDYFDTDLLDETT